MAIYVGRFCGVLALLALIGAWITQLTGRPLAGMSQQRVYQLDKTGQEKAREFAGQKVKVTGRVSGRTIHVTSIEATS